jgi:uncharacterized protein (DUF1330 family)
MKKLLAVLLLCVSASVFAQSKPAYFVTELNIKNNEAYLKEYAPGAIALFAKFGGTQIAGAEPMEKSPNFDKGVNRVTIFKFDSVDKAKAFSNSPERKDLNKIRDKYATAYSYFLEGK